MPDNPQNVVNPIRKVSQANGAITYNGRFGAEAKDIEVNGNSSVVDENRTYAWTGSLQDYIDNLDDYFANSSFTYHGIVTTNQELPSQVKFWYDTNPYYITQQPTNVSISTIGERVSFTVIVNNTNGVTYRWQSSADNGQTWANSNINTSTNQSATYSFDTDSRRVEYLYRCKINFPNNTTAYSKVVSITLN